MISSLLISVVATVAMVLLYERFRKRTLETQISMLEGYLYQIKHAAFVRKETASLALAEDALRCLQKKP